MNMLYGHTLMKLFYSFLKWKKLKKTQKYMPLAVVIMVLEYSSS
jgi:hypothetical protein